MVKECAAAHPDKYSIQLSSAATSLEDFVRQYQNFSRHGLTTVASPLFH